MLLGFEDGYLRVQRITDPEGQQEPDFARSIAEIIKEESDGGAAAGWRSCTGCHETNEGYETGRYPYSRMFGCHVGSGCSECGGLGVVWEHWPEATLAAMLSDTSDIHRCPVCAVPFRDGDVCATDIELGTCHAECLDGCPTVNLDTGEPIDGPIPTYPYEPLDPTPVDDDISRVYEDHEPAASNITTRTVKTQFGPAHITGSPEAVAAQIAEIHRGHAAPYSEPASNYNQTPENMTAPKGDGIEMRRGESREEPHKHRPDVEPDFPADEQSGETSPGAPDVAWWVGQTAGGPAKATRMMRVAEIWADQGLTVIGPLYLRPDARS